MSETNSEDTTITIAKWSDRFFAWLIDFCIISTISIGVISIIFGKINYEIADDWIFTEMTQFVPTSIIFFVYWTILEGMTGQTIGKKIMNLQTTNMVGNRTNWKGVMISSFGKSFLLPLDVLFGWIFTNDNRQRIFNKIGDTIVIKIKHQKNTDIVKYKKD